MKQLFSQPTAVALGVFDGVHLGHRAVLHTALQLCRDGENIPCVFTFRKEEIISKKGAKYLYPFDMRCDMMSECGIRRFYCPSFAEMQAMSGRDFAKDILHEGMNAAHICCGKNFRFGASASCDAHDLEQLGTEFGFQVHIVDDVQRDGMTVSSTEIRKLLSNGEIEKANQFLGEPYRIYQEVSHGAQLGRTIGFPTINQLFREGQLVPRFGVYASETSVNGRWYPSLTNIGMKPTVNYAGLPLAETYIREFSGDLYGKPLTVRLLRFIRPEMKFSSVEELHKQMTKDLQS